MLEDDMLMWGVFQAFVLNFFKTEQKEFSVKAEYIQWDALALNAESSQYLPVMRTDVIRICAPELLFEQNRLHAR
jgi:hypothetical protein